MWGELAESSDTCYARGMTQPTAAPKQKTDKIREHDDRHPAYHRLPPGRPLAECQPINHPRGKDGCTWGH